MSTSSLGKFLSPFRGLEIDFHGMTISGDPIPKNPRIGTRGHDQ